MKTMNRIRYYIWLVTVGFLISACSEQQEAEIFEKLAPVMEMHTEHAAEGMALGCYSGWEDGGRLLFMDCTSDFGYSNFPWEGYKDLGNGSMTQFNSGTNFYGYATIRRCNAFLNTVRDIPFANEFHKKSLIAEIRVIRAYKYFVMNWLYGGVPIVSEQDDTEEALLTRASEAEVRQYIADELDECIPDLQNMPSKRGRIGRGAALALRMRESLYYGDWSVAKRCAEAIIASGNYSLEPDYSRLFQVEGQDSPEIMLAVQYIPQTYTLYTIGQMYNNAEGGWSSIVPTYNLVDAYEMENGLTIHEPGSGYDEAHPFKDRDPRLAMTVLYPGADYVKADGTVGVFNSLDPKLADGSVNANYMTMTDKVSKTGLTWNKYLNPITQYEDIWASNACPIVFRYAEVLLSWAEAANELEGPSDQIYLYLDEVRNRVGMPNVDRDKYDTKEKLRELIRRERGVEFAGEGLRRADIVRWKTADGKMMAEQVMNGYVERRVGTVGTHADPELRATISQEATPKELQLEKRVFKPYHRYFPLAQGTITTHNLFRQNPGY